MAFRTPESSPVVLVLYNEVFAIEPATGRLLWSWRNSTVHRIFSIEDRVFPCVASEGAESSQIHCLRLMDGTHLGVVNVPFFIASGVTRDRCLVVAGETGAALVSYDGILQWVVTREFVETPLTSSVLRCRGTGPAVLWEAVCPGNRMSPAVMFGDAVAQADQIGKH
jgi:hypothetical protein